MRRLFLFAGLAALLPNAAFAADCKLQMLDIVRLEPAYGGAQERIPVTINGVQKTFLFDTGGYLTQVARQMADELKLPVRQGRIEMMSVTGQISRDQASLKEFIVGHMRGVNMDLPVSPNDLGLDGIAAVDVFRTSDIDLDFGSDTLRLFSQDHCPGQVVYWTSPANAGIVPLVMRGDHAVVTVKLDGQDEHALIDTGAPRSTLTIDEAVRAFHLTMGSDGTPEKGSLNGDESLKTYSHEFKTLSFGDVAVSSPALTLIPNAFGRNMDKAQLVGDRTKSEKDLLDVQEMIIGMDILRKMHVYISLSEQKMYVTQVSTASAAPATQPAPTN